MRVVGREEEEESCEERRGLPWQLFLTHTLDRAHQRPQLTKNAKKKKKSETGITSRSCLWRAACLTQYLLTELRTKVDS